MWNIAKKSTHGDNKSNCCMLSNAMQNAPLPTEKEWINVAHVRNSMQNFTTFIVSVIAPKARRKQETLTFCILIYDVAGCFLALWSSAVPTLLVAATEREWSTFMTQCVVPFSSHNFEQKSSKMILTPLFKMLKRIKCFLFLFGAGTNFSCFNFHQMCRMHSIQLPSCN